MIVALTPAEAVRLRDFLWSVLGGKDVDAVRFSALDKLEEGARSQPSSLWLASKLCGQLQLETKGALRYGFLDTLAHLYGDHPEENGFLFDVMVQSLSRDAEGKVRGNAASILAVHFDPARSIPALTSALQAEQDAKARTQIERALKQAQIRRR